MQKAQTAPVPVIKKTASWDVNKSDPLARENHLNRKRRTLVEAFRPLI